MFMKNKDKLIAEIMAVCCALSTSTFFNMYGMAEPDTVISFLNSDGTKTGTAIFGTQETYSILDVEYNVGCINFIIDFSQNYSDCVINQLLAMLNLNDVKGNPINDYTKITSEAGTETGTEIYNLGQLFGDENSLIKFTVYTPTSDELLQLRFNDSETTNSKKQTQFTNVFSIFRIGDKRSTIQYVENEKEHIMTLKIYIDLPDNSIFTNYKSFSFGVELKNKDMLQIK